MKQILSILAICVGVVTMAQSVSGPEFTLPSDYKQAIRDYVTKKPEKEGSVYAGPILSYFTPGIAKVVRGNSPIPKDRPMRAVLVHWTPKAANGSVYLMTIIEVFVFKDEKLIGFANEADVEWLDGSPKKEE